MKLVTVLIFISLIFCTFFSCRAFIDSSNAPVSLSRNDQINESDRKELEDLVIVTLVKISAWSTSVPTPCRDGLITSLPENLKNKAGSIVKGELTIYEDKVELDIPELHYCLFFIKTNSKFYFLKDYSYCGKTFLLHKKEYPLAYDQSDQLPPPPISSQLPFFIKLPEISNPIVYLNILSSNENIQDEVYERLADSIASDMCGGKTLTVLIPHSVFFIDRFFVYVHESKGGDHIAVIRTILPETSGGKFDYTIDRIILRKDELDFFREKITSMSPKRLVRSCSASGK